MPFFNINAPGVSPDVDLPSVDPEAPASQPESQDYWGNAPGIDLGDFVPFIGQHDSVWGHGIKGAMNVLDTGGRGVRTLLDTGDFGKAGEALLDPEKATSATDLRRKYLFGDLGDHSDKGGFATDPNTGDWSLSDAVGDTADFLGDLAVGTVTDPLAWLHPGLTPGALRAKTAAQELIGTGIGKTGLLTEAERLASIGKYNAAVDDGYKVAQNFIPTEDWNGLAPTHWERLKAGQEGLGVGLPHIPGTGIIGKGLLGNEGWDQLHQTVQLPVGKAAAVLSPITNPIDLAANLFMETAEGKAVAKRVGGWIDAIRNPEVRTAAGLSERNANNIANEEMRISHERTKMAFDRAGEAGVPADKLPLATKLLETFDPENRAATLRIGGKLRQEAGVKSFEEVNREIVTEVNALPKEQQAALYQLSQDLHGINMDTQTRLAERGIDAAKLGDAVRLKVKTFQEDLSKLDTQIASERKTLDNQQAAGPTAEEATAQELERLKAENARLRAESKADYTYAKSDKSPRPLRPDAGVLETLENPNPDQWNKVQSDYFGKKRSLEDTVGDRQALVATAKRIQEAKSAEEAWTLLEGMDDFAVKRLGKALNIGGTQDLAVTAEKFPTKAQISRRILYRFEDGKGVVEKANEVFRETRRFHAGSKLDAEIGGGAGEVSITKADTMAAPGPGPEELAIAREEGELPAGSDTGSTLSREEELAQRAKIDSAPQAQGRNGPPVNPAVLNDLEDWQKPLVQEHLNQIGKAQSVEEAATILADISGDELKAVGKAFGVGTEKGIRKRVAALFSEEAQAARAVPVANDLKAGAAISQPTAENAIQATHVKENINSVESLGGEVPRPVGPPIEGEPVVFPRSSPKLEALLAQREELAAQLAKQEDLVREIPNYVPHVAADDTKEQLIGKFTGTSGGAAGVNKERGMVYPEGHPLAGIPMTQWEAEAHLKQGGAGTKGTGYKEIRGKVPVQVAVKKFFAGEEGLKAVREMTEDAHFFEQDPRVAYTKYFNGRFRQSVFRDQLTKNFKNVFRGIDVTDWREVESAVAEGRSFDEVNQMLKAKTGLKVEDVMRPETVARIKAGAMDVKTAFKDGSMTTGPYGWASSQHAPGTFMPAGAVEKFDKVMDLQGKRMPEFLEKAAWPMMAFTKIWKPFQTYFFPKFHLRNFVGDMVRMAQEDALDAHTGRDMATLWSQPERWLNGYGADYSKWANAQFNLGRGGLAHYGSEIVSGDRLLRDLGEAGMFRTGYAAQELLDAAEQSIKPGLAKQYLPKLTSSLDKMKAAAAFREDAQRISAVAARMRAGDTFMEATLRATDALYDFGNVSPMAQFLRRTGISPFLAWQMKNIPAQLEYAVTKPGQFAALMRGFEIMQGDELPEHLLPDYMQKKYNVTLTRGKDSKGNPVYGVATDSGFLPMTDLSDMMRNPTGYVREQLGPLLKLGLDWYDMKDNAPATDWADMIARDTVGKPYTVGKKFFQAGTVDKHGYERQSVVDAIAGEFKPLSSQSIHVLDQVKRSETQIKRDLGMARTAVNSARGTYNQMLLTLSPDDPHVLAQEQNVQDAQIAFTRAQREHDRIHSENVKVRERMASMSLAP